MTTDDKWSKAYDRARSVVSQMTIPEKVNLTTGSGWEADLCVGNTGSVPRFNIPSLCMQDGPLGVRFTDFISAFPAGITAGASFNKELIAFRGKALALEHKAKGVHVVLGPAVGPLGRNALGGRTWEGFGADPYLQGVAARATTREIQKAGLVATIKHFIGNEQEHFRQVGEYYGSGPISQSLSSNIDDRTMHEIYMWPFADVVNEGVGSVMCSYNTINNTYACENSYLINKLLKEELGFQGFVMSDWWAMKTGIFSAQAGLDMAMPGDSGYFTSPDTFWGNRLTRAVLDGSLGDWRLDDMAVRILAAYYYVGLDSINTTQSGPNFSSWTKDTWGFEHPLGNVGWREVNKHVVASNNDLSKSAALQVATEGIVLLKNSGNVLPLVGGSLNPRKINIFGKAAGPDPRGANCKPDFACSDGALGQGWGSGAVDFQHFVTPFEAVNDAARKIGMTVDYDFTAFNLDGFLSKVSIADANIIFALTNAGEGFASFDSNYGDRRNASLWHNADEVILRAAEKNKNNIVVISSVGPTNLERWIDHPNIKAVLFALPGGQDAGIAVANVLFGLSNPSGKLPFTIARDDKDYIPIVTSPGNGKPQADFTEGIYVDYRLFDKNGLTPRYEFGYGLSYSSFGLSDFKIESGTAPSEQLPQPPSLKPVSALACNKPTNADAYTFPPGFAAVPRYIYPWLSNSGDVGNVKGSCINVTDAISSAPLAGGGLGGNPALFETAYTLSVTAVNNGPFPGSQAFQLYVEYPQGGKYDVPPRQLRGFEKPYLNVGQSAKLTFKVQRRDLSVWDVESQSWVVPRGKYRFLVGNSSRDLPLSAEITI